MNVMSCHVMSCSVSHHLRLRFPLGPEPANITVWRNDTTIEVSLHHNIATDWEKVVVMVGIGIILAGPLVTVFLLKCFGNVTR